MTGITGFYRNHALVALVLTQPTFICSKSTIESLEKDMKYVQS